MMHGSPCRIPDDLLQSTSVATPLKVGMKSTPRCRETEEITDAQRNRLVYCEEKSRSEKDGNESPSQPLQRESEVQR